MPSPPYVAVIVTSSGELVAGVYDVVHVPDVSVQEDVPNNPPTLPSLHVTNPVGVFCEFDVSATVTVNVSVLPDAYDAGFGDIVDVVGDSALDVNDNVPEFVV